MWFGSLNQITRSLVYLVPNSARATTKGWYAHCDADAIIPDTVSLEEYAEQVEAEEGEAKKLKPPSVYSDLRNNFGPASIQSFDGFRLILQKQMNLNTVVSHFFWLGSAAMNNQPLYKYTIILPHDEKMLQVGTDMDMNLEGEIKAPINDNIALKSHFATGANGNMYHIDLEAIDTVSATQLSYAYDLNSYGGIMYSLSYMQTLTKSLSLGGSMQYTQAQGDLATSFGGVYDDEENCFVAQYGGPQPLRMMYMKRVNPNRVHLTTELSSDANGETVSIGAEYRFKQSTIHCSVDNNLMIKSTVENQLSQGVHLVLSAEMAQAKDHYRFGYQLIMG